MQEKPLEQWEDHQTHVMLNTPDEFNFDEVLGYLTRSTDECLHQVVEKKVYKVISINGTYQLLRIVRPTPSAIQVYFEKLDQPPKKSVRIKAARYVWDWFSLGTNLIPFYRMAQKDPLLQGLITKYYGLRIVGVEDLFEALCWAIIGQQIHLKFAYMLKRRFIETFGTPIQRGNQTYWLFPTPETIADLSTEDIVPLKFTQRKSEYLIEVAKRMSAGELSKQKLLGIGDLNKIMKELTKIRGIGHWTANYVAMRCLKIPSAFPIQDIGLQNAVKQQLGLDQKPTLAELREISSNWSGWEAYATFYLWRSMQDQE